MGGSTSKSANSTSWRAQDERMAGDGHAIQTRAGGNVTINQTSGEAVDLGEAYADAAHQMSDGAFAVARSLGGDAIDLSEAIASDAFTFADRNTGDAMSLSRDALRLAERGAGAGDSAMRMGGNALRDALEFADGQGLRAMNQMGAVTEEAIRASSDNLDEALSFAGDDRDAAYSFAKGVGADAMNFAEAAMSASRRESATALGALSSGFSQTLAAKAEDSTQLGQQLIRLGIPAVALVLIAGSFTK